MKYFYRLIGAVFAFCVLVTQANATPQIEHWQTRNDARVYFVSAMELPILDIKIVFDAGSARDGNKAGLASLTNALLDDGAGSLNADQIAEKLEGLGAQMGTSSHRDMAILSLRSLTDKTLLEPALDTISLILARPTFPADAFSREQQRTLVAIRAQQESPGKIAGKAFYKAIYGQHPYASPTLGAEQTVSGLGRADVVAFHRQYYVASNAVIAIVGAIDRFQAEDIAEKITASLPRGKPEPPPLPAVRDLEHATKQHLAHPSTQTHILVGQPAISRLNKDYFALYVGNHILGGSGLVSRISEEIREKRGLSYSAYSYFAPMHERGPFVMGLQTRNSQVTEALKVLQKVLADFVASGPTAKELKAAQQNITGSFALRIASNAKIADQIAMIGFYGLPLNYLNTFNERVNAVTTEAIHTAFQKYLDPKRMATIIVGAENASEDGTPSHTP